MRTPEEAVEDYNREAQRLHTGSMVDELVEHIRKRDVEVLRDAATWLDSFEGPGGRASAHDAAGRDIVRLIRERADRIEREAGQ